MHISRLSLSLARAGPTCAAAPFVITGGWRGFPGLGGTPGKSDELIPGKWNQLLPSLPMALFAIHTTCQVQGQSFGDAHELPPSSLPWPSLASSYTWLHSPGFLCSLSVPLTSNLLSSSDIFSDLWAVIQNCFILITADFKSALLYQLLTQVDRSQRTSILPFFEMY